jgi:acetyl/propionyl-CoA carboxylase alpha subunit
LPLEQQEVALRGHAIEARVYAEDPARNFLPQAGTIARARWPRGPFVRVDAGVESGDGVPVHYDPILAKIIASGADRDLALARLGEALDDTVVHGVITNVPFLRALAHEGEVQLARFDTEWIEREFMNSFVSLATAPAPELAVAAAALAESFGGASPAATYASAASAPRGTAFEALGRWRQPGLE